jgi:hypothetical protein
MNERGYGTEIVLDGGYAFDTALCWYFVGDNGAPPTAGEQHRV